MFFPFTNSTTLHNNHVIGATAYSKRFVLTCIKSKSSLFIDSCKQIVLLDYFMFKEVTNAFQIN